VRTAKRIEKLPPYLFAEIDRKVAEAKARGADIISFGVGDPDLPTPPPIVATLIEAAKDSSTHRYPSYTGMPAFRESIAGFYERRFGVKLDPDTQIQPLVGSKEGIFHLPVAFVDPGDVALIPDPGYPVYETGTILSHGEPVLMPMTEENGFKPAFGELSSTVTEKARVMWLNYPSNPTAAVAEPAFFEDAVAFAREHDLLLAHDAAYSELTYDGFTAPSVLQVPGAKDVAVEFGSLSKTYNMTGWRVGWVAGNSDVVRALATVKTNIDSGIFNAIQQAAIAALTGPQDMVDELRAVYQKRRDLVVSTLNSLGWDLQPPRGSIYVWLPTKDGMSSAEFCEHLLERARVVLSPGSGYGAGGEGYARISLTVPDDRLAEAMDRIQEALA
jgi:LL-diaminopimelate aminotransferase